MSIELLNAVFKSEVRPSARKFVLVALADYANEDGVSYPSIARLSEKTSLERKTIIKHLAALVEAGFLKDTGERKGKTKQVVAWQITMPKTEQFQKRNSSKNGIGKSAKNGTVTPRKSTKNGTRNHQIDNPQKEPPEKYASLAKKLNVPVSLIHSIVDHRKKINKPANTDHKIEIVVGYMRDCVEQGYFANLDQAMVRLSKEEWQTIRPNYITDEHPTRGKKPNQPQHASHADPTPEQERADKSRILQVRANSLRADGYEVPIDDSMDLTEIEKIINDVELERIQSMS